MIKLKSAVLGLIPAAIFGLLFFWYAASIGGGEYQPLNNIHIAVAGFAWCLFAAISIFLSVGRVKQVFRQSSKSYRYSVIALNAALTLALLTALALASYSLQQHILGRSGYQAAQQRCGHMPILAEAGFGDKTYIRPGSREYERLKYTVDETKIIGPSKYFCSESEASAQGYRLSPLQ